MDPVAGAIISPELGAILVNLTQALTAFGVIVSAGVSWWNGKKLNDMDAKIIAAAVAAGVAAAEAAKAAANTDVIVAKADEVKEQLREVRDAAVAVNAEVIDKIQNGTKQ